MNDLVEPVFSHDLDVFDVADYLIQQDSIRPEPDVTPLKLAKLLYLAQANYLASTGHRLFAENIEAFDNGPIIHREWRRHPGKQIIAVSFVPPAPATELPGDVIEFLDALWARFQDYSASTLWRLAHEQAPWRDSYVPGKYRTQIPDESMASYFRDQVPASDRVFHANVVLMPKAFLDESDADALAANNTSTEVTASVCSSARRRKPRSPTSRRGSVCSPSMRPTTAWSRGTRTWA